MQQQMQSQFEYFSSLLPKLYNSIKNPQSNIAQPLSPALINYYKRILTSRWNILQSNESQIISSLFDSAERLISNSNQNISSIERLQSLYSRLAKKKFPSKRWECLYLLNGLSKANNSQQFQTPSLLNNMDTNNQNPNNYDNDITNDLNALNYLKEQKGKIRSQFDLDNNPYVKRPSPVCVDMNQTSKIITERDLVNDLMFILQGIDGHYISYVAGTKDMFCLNTKIPFNEDVFDIIYNIAELGWLYKKVTKYLTFFNETNIPSQFIQSFSYAVQSELNEYYKLISFFKKKLAQTEVVPQDDKKQSDEDQENNLQISSENDLTLKNLVLWTIEPLERMKWLAMSCESVYTLRGTSVLSQIYSYVNFAGGDCYLKRVLDEISKPFLFFVRNWILHGDLQDPYKEFFVNILDQTPDDDIWTLKYQLVYKNIPNFLSKNLAIKIFEIGKCIHFIKSYCGESDYSLSKLKQIIIDQINAYNKMKEEENKMDIVIEDNTNINTIQNLNNQQNNLVNVSNNNNQPVSKNSQNLSLKDVKGNQFIDINSYLSCLDFLNSLDNFTTDTNYANEYANEGNDILGQGQNGLQVKASNFLSELLIQLDLLHSLINKELLSIIYNKFNFKENLIALNRYLLLGQGDMMQSLMESLYDELKKPASHIFKHNLQANLEAAIRATNAQYNDQECLKKLNIKLMDPNAGDTGWDIFLLDYNVDVPLTVIFSKDLLKEYQKLFFFFWKLKRIEFSQNHQVWRKFMNYSHSLKKNFNSMRKIIHRSMLFNQQVVHFITNLHNFVALEVLETQFKKIIDILPQVKSLDELIEAHKKFINNISEQSLLCSENNSIYKKVLQIFDIIIRFRIALDVLATTFLEGHYENIKNPDVNDSMNMNIKPYSTEASTQIQMLFEEFKSEVCELINSIEFLGKGNLKYLSMKLDYNYYYSRLEKEKENQEQQKELEQINREEEIRRQNEIRRRREMNQEFDDSQNVEGENEEGNGDEDFKEVPSGVGDDLEEGNIENSEEEIDTRRNRNQSGIDENSYGNDGENYEEEGDDINMNENTVNLNTSSRVNTNQNNISRSSDQRNISLNQSRRSNINNSRYSKRNNHNQNDDF